MREAAPLEHRWGHGSARLAPSIGAEFQEDFCRVRGEHANHIKEAHFDPFAYRLSAATFRGNQLPRWLASTAYVLMHTLRFVELAATALTRVCAHTIRLKLPKIGAVVAVSVRRVRLAMSEPGPISVGSLPRPTTCVQRREKRVSL